MDFPRLNLKVFWSFMLFHAILLSSINSGSPSVFSLKNETDRLALIAFKDGISNDPLGVLSSWNHCLHFCEWEGVACSHRNHQRVTILNLTGHSLAGHLSPHIGNLSFLRRIDLSSNKFQGQIPQEIGRLFRLQILNLTDNSLQEEIPSNLSHCSELVTIDVGRNQLIGKLPAELGSLSKLIFLSVAVNDLRGSIPPSLGNLSSLTSLTLSRNSFNGQIPNQLGQLAGLINFRIGENQLSGTIPPSIYNLSSIQMFSVVSNQLHGSLPSNLGLAFPHLRWIFAGGNQFTGTIPISLSNASRLINVDFAFNSLSGPLPVNLGSLPNLYRINIARNQLGSREGDDDMSFLTSLTNCTRLDRIGASTNNLYGELPGSIANLSTQLKIITLGQNKIFGTIPKEIENLVGLYGLDLKRNSLKGTLPDTIGKLTKLNALSLQGNKLSGRIPPSIGNITRLSVLELNGNDFHGSIPSSFGNWGFMESLLISKNKLDGTILKQVSAAKINLSGNSFTGSLQLEVDNLKNIRGMDFSDNKLSGEIPDTLGNCQILELLYMNGNLFQGTIPKSLRNLKGIIKLDLSRNNLSGQIPKYFEEFLFLQYLNLSFNNFEGEVPKGGIFSNASAISVMGNNKLCGGIPELQFPECLKQASKKRGKLTHRVKVTVISVVSSSFLLLCVIATLYCRRNSPRKASSPSSTENQWLQVSYADLLQATDRFSSTNLIGVGNFGSVYKGILECFETLIAVKVLNLLQQGAFKSFLAECEAIRNIRHRNLVKILTICSSIDFNGNDFKALVFEYMPNGSLEKWLHPNVDEQHQLRNLNLTQRLNIAIDVALALEYLHHHSQTPIVHRDLKPSNVLLDDDMVAHVGDFGLARFLSKAAESCSQNQTSTSGIKGSIGYIPPEYGMGGKASTQGDVYSYGILLLEMITGKRPTDDMFKDNLNIHHLAKSAFPEQVMEIIDPRLLPEDAEAIQGSKIHNNLRNTMRDCLVSLVRIGVSCSAESPRERLEMKDIATEMHAIRDLYLGVGIRQHREISPYCLAKFPLIPVTAQII